MQLGRGHGAGSSIIGLNPLPDRLPIVLMAVVTACTVVSAITPYDRPTWWLEAAPVVFGVVVALMTGRRFPLTSVLYVLLTVHAVILVVGAHWTYARVPAGFWVSDAFGWERNHYDRLAHFVQGFVPAILARELLIRLSRLAPGPTLFVCVTAVALAFSALYEMAEWAAALIGGHAADDFLGTQGDPWDTQWDMFLALIGALTSQTLLGRVHDAALADPRFAPKASTR